MLKYSFLDARVKISKMNISRAEILISLLFLFFAKKVDCSKSMIKTNVEDRLKLNFCWTNNAHTPLTCSDIQTINKNVTCIKETDGISCLKLLLNKKADFMIAEPEELMAVGMNETENNQIAVTHELVATRVVVKDSFPATKLRMVVVASKEIENLNSSPKKRLCSFGFEWKNYIKYFEKRVVAQHCDPNKTLLENRISSLADAFDSNCLGNAKNYEDEFYKKIMTKYKNLHSGCSKFPRNSAAPNEEEAVECLFEKQGDILWAKLTDVQGYFKSQLDFNKASANFHFICPDGTTRNLTNPDPCVWFKIPSHNIIARKDIAAKVHRVLPIIHYHMYSIKLTHQNSLSKKGVNINQITPNEYLNLQFPELVSLVSTVSHCKLRRTINWCITTGIEARKCDSLSKAAKVYGIEPLINCVQESSREMCIESVRNNTSDMFVVNVDETFQAKMKGLKPIAHLFARDEAPYNQTVAMIPEKILLSIKSLKDLKNNTACFTAYRGAGWNAFIHLMGEMTGNKDWYCEDKKMVSQFFNETCVVNLSEQNSTFPTNLYSFCSKLPVNDTGDAEKKVWSCLDHGAGVAFVTHKNESKSDKLPLCIDGDWQNSMFSPEECLLTQSAQASIMIHDETPQLREDEIRVVIQDLQRLFGTPFMRYKIFSLFGHFEGTAGIIFPKNTVRMELVHSHSLRKLSQEAILNEIDSKRELCDKLNSIDNTYYSIIT